MMLSDDEMTLKLKASALSMKAKCLGLAVVVTQVADVQGKVMEGG